MFELRRQHTAHRLFHFIDQLVNDGVVTQIDVFSFNHTAS
ncbi:Uncharacterised protein [Vibrio cholerae]|nr:Uncharacterised protein [Vibrio cholerae]